MKAWYAVHTKGRQESVAEENLSRQGYVVHLPLLRAPRRSRGRWREAVEPLFPGYLFVELDLALDNPAPIRSTRGVTGLVRFGGHARPMPEGVVEHLVAAAQRADDGAVRCEHLFAAGDRVEIVDGPLAGLRAVFLAPSGDDRVRLLLDLLGREHSVTLSRHQLVPASQRG
jgi:transcriptional antiterminator RfaH